MLAAVDQLLPKMQDLAAPSPHWGGSTKSLLILILLGVSTFGPLAYLFVRDWRLERNFRRFWKSNAGKDAANPAAQPTLPSPPRQTLIKESKSKRLAQKPLPAPPTQSPNSASRGPAAAPPKPPPATHTATSLGMSAVPAPGETNVGMVHIHANDEFCEVFIDDLFVGHTPAALALKEGAHAVTVKRTGFRDYCRELFITKGAQLTLQATLEPTPANGHHATVLRQVSNFPS